LVFVFQESPSEEQEAGIVEVVRSAYAEVLEVEASEIIVKIAAGRRLDSQKRQLAAELRLLVQISHASAASFAFVSLETGQRFLMAKINRKLAVASLPMYLTSTVRQIAPIRLPPPDEISRNSSKEGQVAEQAAAKEEGGGLSAALVLAIIALSVTVISVLVISLIQHWRARIRKFTIVHRSIEKAQQNAPKNSEDSSDSDPGSPCGEQMPP
jgi:hypothetical protein